MRARIVVVGQSNARTLRDGYELREREATGPADGPGMAFVMKRSDHLVTSRWGPDGWTPGERSTSTADVLDALDPTHLVLMWGGNQMNVRALLALGPPFDVVLPSDDGTPVPGPDTTLVPCTVIRSFVRDRLTENGGLQEVVELGRARGARGAFLCPPPPIPERGVRPRLADSPHFVGVLEELGVGAGEVPIVPDEVRRKLWVLLASEYAAFAAEHGLDVVGQPAGTADASGMLAERYWGSDATHGNAAYGRDYLAQVLDWAAGTAG